MHDYTNETTTARERSHSTPSKPKCSLQHLSRHLLSKRCRPCVFNRICLRRDPFLGANSSDNKLARGWSMVSERKKITAAMMIGDDDGEQGSPADISNEARGHEDRRLEYHTAPTRDNPADQWHLPLRLPATTSAVVPLQGASEPTSVPFGLRKMATPTATQPYPPSPPLIDFGSYANSIEDGQIAMMTLARARSHSNNRGRMVDTLADSLRTKRLNFHHQQHHYPIATKSLDEANPQTADSGELGKCCAESDDSGRCSLAGSASIRYLRPVEFDEDGKKRSTSSSSSVVGPSFAIVQQLQLPSLVAAHSSPGTAPPNKGRSKSLLEKHSDGNVRTTRKKKRSWHKMLWKTFHTGSSAAPSTVGTGGAGWKPGARQTGEKPSSQPFGPDINREWEIVTVRELCRRLSLDDSFEPSEMPLPEGALSSRILDEFMIRQVIDILPPRAEGYPWVLVYSSEKNGFSLATLYRKMAEWTEEMSPILLVIRDTQGHVFGAVASTALRPSEHGYYGTGDSSLLFRFTGEYPHTRELRSYTWTGDNQFFINATKESLSMGAGGGHYGIWLDADLNHGRSQKCTTFDNEPLAGGLEEDFVVQYVEAFGFSMQ